MYTSHYDSHVRHECSNNKVLIDLSMGANKLHQNREFQERYQKMKISEMKGRNMSTSENS